MYVCVGYIYVYIYIPKYISKISQDNTPKKWSWLSLGDALFSSLCFCAFSKYVQKYKSDMK